MSDHQRILSDRTQQIMAESDLSWRQAWLQAEDEVEPSGTHHDPAPAQSAPGDASKRRFWKALSLALGVSWVLLYMLPFFVGSDAFWDAWALRLWLIIPPMTFLAQIGLAVRTPSGRRYIPATVAGSLTFVWICVLFAIALHI